MALNLEKRKPLDLEKGLTKLKFVLGWEEKQKDTLDLDSILVLLDDSGKSRSDSDCVFYNQLDPYGNKSAWSEGDSRNGGEEIIHVDLTAIPDYVSKIHALITIHDAENRGHHFGLLNQAYAKVFNDENGKELYYIDLDEEASQMTCVVVVEVYKENGKWKIQKLNEKSKQSLVKVLGSYGF